MTNNEKKVAPARWVKAELYCQLTGHTKWTIQKCKNIGVWKEGVHWKAGPEGPGTFYYNVEEIDKLIDEHVALC